MEMAATKDQKMKVKLFLTQRLYKNYTLTGRAVAHAFYILKVKVNKLILFSAHWDGWQPFSSSLRGCGAIEVTIATKSKVERCKAEEVYVVGFVPSHMLPNKRPIYLDPFLDPFVADIEDGFINGIPVNYKAATCGKPAGVTTLRHLVLCFSGDHCGFCEVGKFIKMGKSGCVVNLKVYTFQKQIIIIIQTSENKLAFLQKRKA